MAHCHGVLASPVVRKKSLTLCSTPLLAASLVACSAAVGVEPQAAPDPADDFAVALERAITDPGSEPVILWARSWIDDGFVSVVLYGRGVGIWNDEKAFDISRQELAALLSMVKASGFAAMPPIFGGAPRPTPRPDGHEREPSGPVRIVTEIEVKIGSLAKRVEQQSEGEHSAELGELVLGILAKTRERGEGGLGATDLAEGLERLAAGELPPESMTLILHDKPELSGAGRHGREGLLMELQGRSVGVREFTPGEGYRPPRRTELSQDEFQALAGALVEHRPGALPINLYSPRYVDVVIKVLDHRVSIQARQFAGIDATTHGAAQRDFDALLEVLRSHCRRASGRTAED